MYTQFPFTWFRLTFYLLALAVRFSLYFSKCGNHKKMEKNWNIKRANRKHRNENKLNHNMQTENGKTHKDTWLFDVLVTSSFYNPVKYNFGWWYVGWKYHRINKCVDKCYENGLYINLSFWIRRPQEAYMYINIIHWALSNHYFYF